MVVYYFAYGLNMNHNQMKNRCKNIRFVCKAYLENYDFVYDGIGSKIFANIIPKNGSVVWGALWEIDNNDLKRLDIHEGYPYEYIRKKVIVKDNNGKEYDAWVYLREPRKLGNHSEEYRKKVVEGARDCGLPEDYISKKLI
jgi:gamma-glutamylcyclotransferase